MSTDGTRPSLAPQPPAAMNSCRRVAMALSHQEPDRVPFDLGGTVVTGIHVRAYRRLRGHLGLPDTGGPRLQHVFQQLAVVEEDVRTRLRADVRDVAPISSGTFEIEIRDLGDSWGFHDEWGIGWRMPKDGGLYYDMYHHPLAEATSATDLRRYRWPDPVAPARFVGLRERARHAMMVEGQAVALGGFCPGFTEMLCWLRGFANGYADFAANEGLVCSLMDMVCDLKMAYWQRALAEAGEYASVVQEADDFAAQQGMLVSPATFRRVVKPRLRRVCDLIHSRTRAKIFFHSCGAIRSIIGDLIESGVDALNPVQISAAGMDPAGLKKEFGRDLTFWGGGVDTQRVLGTGTPQQVRDDVRRNIDALAPGGGFVFAAVHNIQANVPPANIMAMWEALQEFGLYRRDWADPFRIRGEEQLT